MSLVHNNPFTKPNPYKITEYDPFRHPNLNPSTTKYTHLFYYDPLLTSRSTNILWDFKQNNLSHAVDFDRNYSSNNGYSSDF